MHLRLSRSLTIHVMTSILLLPDCHFIAHLHYSTHIHVCKHVLNTYNLTYSNPAHAPYVHIHFHNVNMHLIIYKYIYICYLLTIHYRI